MDSQPKALRSTPDWIRNAIVYQIFPDRFRRSGRVQHQVGLQLASWGSEPDAMHFQGGDLFGVLDQLDQLKQMGINCLYLNPIFSSAANHRYHTYDYFQIDPLLGGDAAFDALVKGLKERDMRLILDGVFNHCGRGFWAFHHLLENGKASPYVDWFMTRQWPLNAYPQHGDDCGYHSWWSDPALPKFNHTNPHVRSYLLEVAEHWMRRGIDGWRLDVADEVDPSFWTEFRQRVKNVKPDAWIIGEVWGDARDWLNNNQFDGVMNYRIAWSTLGWVADGRLQDGHSRTSIPYACISGERYKEIIEETLHWYEDDVNLSQLNLLDSHDTPRALHMLQSDVEAFKLALVLLFILPGVPCVYYGSEVGLEGGAEPQCREAYPWDTPGEWNHDLRDWLSSLVRLRSAHSALRECSIAIETMATEGYEDGLRIYRTSSLDQSIIQVLINRSRTKKLAFEDNAQHIVLWPEAMANKSAPRELNQQSAIVSKLIT